VVYIIDYMGLPRVEAMVDISPLAMEINKALFASAL
jgi:hypothetical protein